MIRISLSLPHGVNDSNLGLISIVRVSVPLMCSWIGTSSLYVVDAMPALPGKSRLKLRRTSTDLGCGAGIRGP
jgi:hypothetical protein